jgi:hypothetical protein
MLTQQFRCIIKQQILTYTAHLKEIHVCKINVGPLHLTKPKITNTRNVTIDSYLTIFAKRYS